MKEILSFFIFGQFLLFFIFLFIFALTFHKCQIVKKAFLSFLFFAFCFTLLFWLFLGSFLALGAGRRAALFSVGLFVCVSVFL